MNEVLSDYQPVRRTLYLVGSQDIVHEIDMHMPQLKIKPYDISHGLTELRSFHGGSVKGGYAAVTRFLRTFRPRYQLSRIVLDTTEYRKWVPADDPLSGPALRREYRTSHSMSALDWLCGERTTDWKHGWLIVDINDETHTVHVTH